MLFYLADIFHFHFFGCHLVSRLRALLQKCDPDKCAHNSHKTRMFFNQADIFHFHSFCCRLRSQLGSLLQKCNPDSRDQNLHKSRLCVFNQQTFSIFNLLAVTWSHNLDPCGKSVVLTVTIKIHMKVVYVFYPADSFHFHTFGCHLGSQLGSLRQKCDPDRCEQNLHKSRLCFLPSRHFQFSFLWLPLEVPPWILTAKVCSWQARSNLT